MNTIMKQILQQHFLEQDWVVKQPEKLKWELVNDYEKRLKWEVEYINHNWIPMVYSLRDMAYYSFDSSWMVFEGNYFSEDEIERLSQEDFRQRFPEIKNDVEDIFSSKANIENNLEIILSPQDVEKWFLELIASYPEEQKVFLKKALYLCKEKHKWQYRDEGTEYYSHPVFVAILWIDMNIDPKDIIILLLHDTLEDTDVTYEQIKNQFWEFVANGVLSLSKKINWQPRVSIDTYWETLSSNQHLALLKWLDRLANLYSLSFATGEKKERYLDDTRRDILPMVEKYSKELAEKIREVMTYIENDVFRLPPEVEMRLKDLEKVKNITTNLEKSI